ncbi:hypothetical protein M8C21_011834 [Ambrosia artemisiifolia]|uniref:Uncharacterized protein n=1 Tax=Ambrosia artemisiifolia TaxID=4212 RepID=A0AAD5CK99_AMBAR|nr:hypothetical protein M8C21_011834 [Ambrosia artemisiifolia]
MHICPESFSCPGLPPFSYPFYNVTDTRCGLIKVNCNLKGGGVQLGGRSYEIVGSTITLFKCPKNLTYAQHPYAYFERHTYNNYNTCQDYNFYYSYVNGTVPSDLPRTCQVVHLPVKLSSTPGLDETNIFSLLSSYTSIFFNLSLSCTECRKKGLLCETKNGHQVQCLDVKHVMIDGEQFRILNLERKVRERTIKILGNNLEQSQSSYFLWSSS